MPYITPVRRRALSHVPLTAVSPETPGELNYAITVIIDTFLLRSGVGYLNINAAVGALECAKMELYRRIATPYEDVKREQHGDVYYCASDDETIAPPAPTPSRPGPATYGDEPPPRLSERLMISYGMEGAGYHGTPHSWATGCDLKPKCEPYFP